MSKVSHSPLGAPRGGVLARLASLFRAPMALALAFALLASLAPLGTPASAQVLTKGQPAIIEDGLTYVIYQTPDGEVSCRLATLDETGPAGDETLQLPVRQINHLHDKESATASSAGLRIVLRATQRLEQNPEAKQAFIKAAAKWEALISSQITVTIDVDYGPDFFGDTAKPYGTNTLGQTSAGGFIPSYSSIRQRLISRAPAGSAEAALLNNLPASALPTDGGDVSTVFITTALTRALGYTIDDATAPVPKIGFNTNFAFDLNPDDGVNATQTDFDSVAVHEIGHALGFNSEVGAKELSTDTNRPYMATVWDFYRFRPGAGPAGFSSAQRVLTPGDPHAYYGGGAELSLSSGNPKGEGGDGQQASHWKDDRFGGPTIGIMDPTISRGRRQTISENDLKAIDLFGYSLAGVAPPPPPPAPANDNFASAQALPGSSGSATGTNVGATSEAGEPNHSPDGRAGGKSIWYNWTAPSGGSVTFNTAGSNFDTVLAAYTGAGVGALTAIIKNDDVESGVVITSSITFNVNAGTTYRIAVDGWGGEVGSIALNWSHAGTAPNPNAIDGNAFFVRQHYLDFLSREPEVGEPWTGVLNNCANVFNTDPSSASALCDRVLVSSAFFRSPEFELKGRYAFRFYKVSFGRLPEYAEIVADMQQLTGATGPETVARRASFASAWVQRADFRAVFDAKSNEEFVNTLMNRYGAGLLLINSPNPSDPENGQKIGLSRTGMITALNTGQWTRAQVLRAVVDSDEVGGVEFNPSFVAMQYYGYLRRAPESTGYQAWLNYLNANPSDFRTMVNGFMNSVEYRRRFGSQ
ncbi:MAG TPA: NF038122 family metalloprotease [Pyrinomonadaceae bacterium]|nr:NF038122 family metalloprotease [Pyrinomonadaceae bacterium]